MYSVYDVPDAFWSQAQKVNGVNYDTKDLRIFLTANLPYETCIAMWVVQDQSKMVGFIVVQPPDYLTRTAYILVAKLDAEYMTNTLHFMDDIYVWAQSVGAKSIGFVSPRDTTAWTRRFGFKHIGTFFVRNL